MGVKMFEARYGAGIINLKQYKDEINGKICCKYCGIPIIYVKEHIREEMVERYGYPWNTIGNAIKGITWKHLPL